MDTFKSSKEELIDGGSHLKEYAKKEYEYSKLKIFFQIASLTTSIAKAILIGTAFTLFTVFISFALAIGLGQLFNNMYLGYIAVAGLYLLIAVFIYAFRSKLERFIVQKLSKTYFDDENI
ncbi:hypothetical protein [Ulvibacter litoralis]|nr:hypothetical protein [Ulvibacter litoralis]